MQYRFLDGGPPPGLKSVRKADPQRVGERLDKLATAGAGQLKPGAVVADARSKASPLHPFFEWDDAKAAHAHRLNQARILIRSITIVPDSDNEQPQPAFVNLNDPAKGGHSYRRVAEVAGSPPMELILMRAALRDLEAWLRRYQRIATMCSTVSVALDSLREQIDDLEAKVGRPPRRGSGAGVEDRPGA